MASFAIMESKPGAMLWLRYSREEDIELQIYDGSDDASNSFGADVTFTWTVPAANRQAFLDGLALRTGCHVLDRAEAVVHAFRTGFTGYAELQLWIDQNPHLPKYVFNSWA